VFTNAQVGFAIGGALVSVVFFGGLAANTATSVDSQLPALRKDLVAVAGVTPGEASNVATAYRTCAVERSKEKDATVVPASCTAPALQDEKVVQVLASYTHETTSDAFSGSLRTTLWVFGGIVTLAFLLMFAVPKQMRFDMAG
jgi:hypothetical protein